MSKLIQRTVIEIKDLKGKTQQLLSNAKKKDIGRVPLRVNEKTIILVKKENKSAQYAQEFIERTKRFEKALIEQSTQKSRKNKEVEG